jgi:hypothetical protein
MNRGSKRPGLGTPGLTRSGSVEWDNRYSFVTLLLQTCANVKCARSAATPPFESRAILDVNVKRLVSIIYIENSVEGFQARPHLRRLRTKGKIEFPQSFPQRLSSQSSSGQRPLETPKSKKTVVFLDFTGELPGWRSLLCFKWFAGPAGAAQAAGTRPAAVQERRELRYP